jgi:hypothetical protein
LRSIALKSDATASITVDKTQMCVEIPDTTTVSHSNKRSPLKASQLVKPLFKLFLTYVNDYLSFFMHALNNDQSW